MKINKQKLELVMAERNLTITDISRMSGIMRHTLYSAMYGNDMYPKTYGKLYKALGLAPEELLYVEIVPPKSERMTAEELAKKLIY